MLGKTYWKDIWHSFTQSKGRVISIVSLMALGSFALIGLKVTGPDMKVTGEHFFRQHQVADLFVMSDYGLSASDQELLNQVDDKATVEYGYFKDVTLSQSSKAIRLFSTPKNVSTYDLVAGKLPTKTDEIALSAAYEKKYQIGDTISVVEKTDENKPILTNHDFVITGFVNSSELLSRVNLGQSSAGSGELSGYALVSDKTFNSDVYMIARLAYDELKPLSPYEQTYTDKVYEKKRDLEKRLKSQPEKRLAELTATPQKQLDEGYQELSDGKAQLEKAKEDLAKAKAQLGDAYPQEAASEAQAKIDQATAQLATKEAELNKAKESLEQLALPSYAVYTRREVPGAEGYLSYANNASIIEAVSNIFPVALYVIAALVTFTTMVRFVDEERLKAGTLRALGYDNKAISRKFVIYGAVTGLIGTAIGTLMGHLLLPSIIYNTYSDKIVLAPIELHFYPLETVLALFLGLLSTVLPALLVVRRELAEQPAQLLLPKAPVAGSTILMEKITPLWSKMSFTQKVTARNIFRYKQRMLMTIFGVCGSVALLFSGLGIRSSIADLNNRQFSDLIKYDMIVAKALNQELKSDAIAKNMSVHYETLSAVAGDQKDEQQITLLTVNASQEKDFHDYIDLVNRQKKTQLSLTDDGAIISEKLETLLDVGVGDTIDVTSSNDQKIALKVAGVSEMYMSHFIFMSDAYYEKVFKTSPHSNADLVILKDDSIKNTNKVASRFMALSAVKGVVQNTILKEQVNTIVTSLNRVMYILIITSILLAIVILYNLTNINVAERIRELSTIKVFGFYNQEVTMYIYRESIYLSLLGILLGFVMGNALHRYMLSVIAPDNIMFNPALPYSVYLLPAILIVLILAVLGLVVNQWLKKVDMLEALKSVE